MHSVIQLTKADFIAGFTSIGEWSLEVMKKRRHEDSRSFNNKYENIMVQKEGPQFYSK